ncbi:hypothetical protein LHJ74_00960 [Streptomyces sp. N2-109]|uniref:Secreted protein n=1 Tax=Streptomyces gossypii TaxID=2883101 RepID=A0ABT2JKY1_9ACTN|nr:hypothetical protein [Streptomyces gossypii]MCT2588527.1 hypothetical protein [Streptomyces gossypii]
MSHPPQPPSGPQQPPPGGAGAPQWPPGQPYAPQGHGYPVPGPPPGNGMPGPPPGGGMPGPPPGGGMPGSGGGRGSRGGGRRQDRRKQKSRLGVVVAAAVAGVLVIGGGVWFVTGGDEGEEGGDSASGPAEAEVLHKVPMPKVNDETGAMGMWTTDKNFVKSGVKEIVGYPLDGGKAAWKIPLGGDVCWSSQTVTKEGRVAVLFEDGKQADPECTEVGLVDVQKGKLLWKKQAVDSWGDTMDFDEVTIGGSTIAAGGTSGGAAWSSEGKELWKPGDDDKCDDNGYAGGEKKLVVVRECGDADPPKLQVDTLDPETGTATSSYQLPPGPEYVHVASTDPLVFGIDTGDAEPGISVTDFMTVDDSGAQGKLLSKIDVLADAYEGDCPATSVEGCTELIVAKSTGTLYLGSDKTPDDQYDIGNKIVAFDLKSGKKKGSTELEEGVALVPLELDKKGSVLAYQEATTSEGGGVWRIDPESFEMTKLQQHPAASTDMESSFSTDRKLRYAGKRLYVGDDLARRRSSDVDGGRPLAVVFGGA